VKIEEFIRRLKKCGVGITPNPSGSSHYLARFQERKVPIPVHENKDFDRGFLRNICRELGIDPREIVR